MPKVILEIIEHMFYNVLMPLMIMQGGCRMEEYEEMTNDEYREKLRGIFEHIESNRILRYFYIYVSEKIKRAR